MEAQQPLNTLAQMLAEVAAMNRDQAVLSRQQLAALQGQAERQTMLMEAMVNRAGAAAPAPPVHRPDYAEDGGPRRPTDFHGDV